jgi:hypothetical protein
VDFPLRPASAGKKRSSSPPVCVDMLCGDGRQKALTLAYGQQHRELEAEISRKNSVDSYAWPFGAPALSHLP